MSRTESQSYNTEPGQLKGKGLPRGRRTLQTRRNVHKPSPPPQGLLASQVALAEDTPSLPSVRPGGLQEAGTEEEAFPSLHWADLH